MPERLMALEDSTDGAVLAEDLELRSPGDFFGAPEQATRTAPPRWAIWKR
ncbi:MAG: hypothetical protein R2911_00260 [Caldilineaceae bacterium]